MKKLATTILFLVLLAAAVLLWPRGDRVADLDVKVNKPTVPAVVAVPPHASAPPPHVASSPEPAVVTNAPVAADGLASLPDAIADEQVLVFYDDADLRAFLAIAAEEGLDVVGQMSRLRAVRVRIGDGSVLRRVLARAPTPTERSANVFVRRPPDPVPPEGVTYSPFADSGPGWLGVNTEQSDWGRGVKVAVLDTAMQADPSLGSVESLDLVGGGAGGAPVHGTAVASIIAGYGDIKGVAPGVNLLAVRVMDDEGLGDAFTLAQGVMDAVDRGARVLNVSVGSMGESFVLQQAIAYAQQQGAIVVAAAGNEGQEGALYPARYPGVVSVGAVDAEGKHVYFSNLDDRLDLVAPGVGVTAAGGDGEAISFSGTSASAPFVAGAIAGVWSESPQLSAREVADLLIAYADDAGAPGHDERYGAGVLNVGRVLEREEPGVVDMALVRPHVEVHPLYKDELILTLFGQNRGTEPLIRVVLTADVDGAPVDLTFYDVAVGAIVQYDMRLTRAGIGDDPIVIQQTLTVEDRDDRSPGNNRMLSVLSVQ